MGGRTLTEARKLRLEPDLAAWYDKQAVKEERPVAVVMRRALRLYADKEARKS